MSEATSPDRPQVRVPDEQMAAPLTHGANVEHSKLAFKFSFLVPDESGAADYVVVRRVLVDPTAMPGFINIINLQWNEWQMENGEPGQS